MHRDPKDPATNVLYNGQAMAILEDACARLRALGLHCSFGPEVMSLDESDMSAVLRVSTAAASLDECAASSLLVGRYVMSSEGRKEFNAELADFRASCAIGKAMNSPDAGKT